MACGLMTLWVAPSRNKNPGLAAVVQGAWLALPEFHQAEIFASSSEGSRST